MRTKGGERVPLVFQKKMELHVWRGEGRGGGVNEKVVFGERKSRVFVFILFFVQDLLR